MNNTTEFAFIFDHDGTLVDSETLHFECWCATMRHFDYDLTEQEYIREHNGVPTIKNAENLIRSARLSIRAEELARRKQLLFAQRATKSAPPLLPTVLEALNKTQCLTSRVAIATGAGDADVARSLEAHGINTFFHAVATNSQVQRGKPAPDVYLLACERLNVAPQNAYAFEDTAAGIAAAKSAGLYCVAIPNKYSAQQDLSRADATCESLLSAVSHCEGLTKA